MPIVFVHGVGTRRDKAYNNATKTRIALMRRFLLPPLHLNADKVTFWNPYWGDDAATFAWRNASLPRRSTEKFGSGEALPALLISEMWGRKVPEPTRIVLETARHSMTDAVDLLWAAASEGASETEADALAELAARAIALTEDEPAPSWIKTVNDDKEFLYRLTQELMKSGPTTNDEAFGPRREFLRLREGLGRIAGVTGRMTSTTAIVALRSSINQSASMFIGDVLVYLRQREASGVNGPIASKVAGELDLAMKACNANDPALIIIAHSMGGNIVYDLLSHQRTDLSCAVLVTVGSQVGVFAELGLFQSVASPVNPIIDRVPKLGNVRRWINVFDPDDFLAFAAQEIFDGAEDYRYSTGRGAFAAHSTYFVRPSFYDRLAARLKGEG